MVIYAPADVPLERLQHALAESSRRATIYCGGTETSASVV
jgi:hypothetical protein